MATHGDLRPGNVDSSTTSSRLVRGSVTGSDAGDVPVTPDDIERAAERVAGHIRRTPVIEHDGLWLKLELLQHAGSFKARGAFNRILSESAIPSSGVIAASGGNHGAAVAYAASQLGVGAEIMIPSTSPLLKHALIERHGARVVVVDGYYDDAQLAADERQSRTGALMLHPFDHPATIAGQGTMGRELEDQLGHLDTLVVASGGGGFTAGQAAWFRDRVRVVSVEPETSQCLRAALHTGAPTDVPVTGIAADSLGARRLGRVPWEIVQHFVDEAVVVNDDAIREAQRAIWDDLRLISEPGGATALAAIRTGAYRPAHNERVAVALCGSNCDPTTIVP
jgi:threonine dehydratase